MHHKTERIGVVFPILTRTCTYNREGKFLVKRKTLWWPHYLGSNFHSIWLNISQVDKGNFYKYIYVLYHMHLFHTKGGPCMKQVPVFCTYILGCCFYCKFVLHFINIVNLFLPPNTRALQINLGGELLFILITPSATSGSWLFTHQCLKWVGGHLV